MSMKDSLNEHDVINSVRLQLRHPSGENKIWIILEGETDQKLYYKLIDGVNVEIEISYSGLSGLLKIVSNLLEETKSIIGIRDADFLHLENKTETINNIFLTDYHDAEMMLIACDNSFNAVAAEYVGRDNNAASLREKLLRSIAFIGGLKWINDAESLGLNFKNFGIGDYYKGETFFLDEDAYLQVIMKRSVEKKREVLRDNVITKIKDVLIKDIFYLYNLCNGHDFHRAFALYINSNSDKAIKFEEIGKAFRVAYRIEDFQETNLYKQLRKWSDKNSKALFQNV